jgi:AcrR family transcriptional regulator
VTAPRRIGAETSKTRVALLDAAERIMAADGYAAVTSRRVAADAGVKPALVHYYFRTMDDLFLALYRRGARKGLERQELALQSAQPLWSLWEFSREPYATGLTMEFAALANHRKTIRAEITASAEQFRRRQVDALTTILEGYGLDPDEWPASVVAVLMSSVARFLVIERETLEMSSGHDETVVVVERLIRRLEGDRVTTA